MSQHLLLAAGVLLCVAGVIAVVYLTLGADRPAGPPSMLGQLARRRVLGRGLSATEQRNRYLIGGAAVLGLIVGWLYTGIPVVGLIVGGAIAGAPWLFGAARAEKAMLARLDALQVWTGRLKDIVRTGVGLNEAIIVSATDAPAPIAAQLHDLVVNLRSGTSTEQALRLFRDSMNDAAVDEVIIAMVVNAREQGPRLAGVLESLAASTTETITMRREVSADRADARLSSWVLSAITIVGVGFLLTNKSYTQAYHTLAGQLILAACIAALAGLLAWMRALNMPRRLPPLLDPVGVRGGRR